MKEIAKQFIIKQEIKEGKNKLFIYFVNNKVVPLAKSKINFLYNGIYCRDIL